MAVVTFGIGGDQTREPLTNVLRNTAITLRVQFKDPDLLPTTVLNPTGQLLHAGVAVPLVALGSAPDAQLRYGLLPVAGFVGRYKLTFLTTGLPAGLYRIVFEGDWIDVADGSVLKKLRIEGDVAIGEISRLDDWIRRVETSLMDDVDPRMYRLDEPVAQWSADQIYQHIQAAVDAVNAFPVYYTSYTIETLPIDQFAIDGARVYALYARARFEKANELDYTDGHTLNIKRADFYKSMADTLYGQWRELVIGFKKMTPPTPIGLKSQQLPFRISRILGLLPNFQTLFSG